VIKTQRSADIVSGLFCVVFGLVVLYAATKITGGMEERLPPRTLPYFLGAAMVISGILLTIKSWRYRGPDPAIKWPDRAGTVRVLVNLVSLALYIFLIYSGQVFFICLRRLGFCFVGGYPHRVATSYPTLINWKVALRRFYLA
jgi:uncharacterized membrane protein HdeD (DUF308 family)